MEQTTTSTRPDLAPYTGAWSEHGFDRAERERWVAAGWRDADQAARWRRAHPDADPVELHELSRDMFRPDQVAQVARFVTSHVGAWTEAFLAPRHEPLDLAS